MIGRYRVGYTKLFLLRINGSANTEMRRLYLLMVFAFPGCDRAFADAPLPPPSPKTVCNTPNTHCATSDPISRKTTLIGRASGEALWVIDGYHRRFDVSNDGRTILLQPDDANLAPVNASREHVLFTIVRDGRAIQSVKISDLFQNSAELRRTTTHLSWGHLEKIDAKDNAIFLLVDGRRVSYSLITGMSNSR